MILHFDPHARAMLTYAMNPPRLVRSLDDAFERPITERTERPTGKPARAPGEDEAGWRERWEPSYG